MTYTITKYACDLCDREYRTESGAVKHQANCYHNSAAKACLTCAHFVATCLQSKRDVQFPMYDVGCNIELDLEDTGMCNGSVQRMLRSGCDGWERRTVSGAYQYGRMMLEEVERE